MPTTSQVPVLHPGDKLTRHEFERRYEAMPELKKAELIEGIVYMMPRIKFVHGQAVGTLAWWTTDYARETPGVEGAINSSLRIDQDNEAQPDDLLRIRGAQGASFVDAEDFLNGAPELIVEVAASAASYDLHQKKHVYRRCGVREYLVLRTDDAAVDWFVLRRGIYERLLPDAQGIVRSDVFPGLWLDVPALLRDDLSGLRAAVLAGLQAPEHAAFCDQLQV